MTDNLYDDGENRMVKVTKGTTAIAACSDDGDGLRVRQVLTATGATTTAFVKNYYEQSGTTITKYYYAGSQRVAVRTGTDVRYLFGDHLGSTSVNADVSGGSITRQLYKAWGETRYTSSLPTKYQYTGQYSEDYIKLVWMNSRWYDPALGRWTQADIVIPDPLNSADFDRYNYVRSNPVRYNDPSGHCLGPLAEVCAHIMLELMVDLIATDLLDGRFDTPAHVRTAVVTTQSVFTNNPFAGYRDASLVKYLADQVSQDHSESQDIDLTYWLVNTMNSNASGSVVATLQKLNGGGIPEQATAIIAWTALVKGGGPWDYKVEFGFAGVSNVILGGQLFSMDVVANIHYGFVGAASGFNLRVLQMGAGGAQLMDGTSQSNWAMFYFDDPRDSFAVWFGYMLYMKYGPNLTIEQFQKAIEQYQNSLQPPNP